ncbi:MFS transporter [Allorhizocola rhizosphaerae]|uniref:MFS transporter n=1 Tax=Allorhizocola rhizosphaerae TaxID=1872709 RepID=UPI000E3BF907|nr:MFS transporter [Allorhizocola rhizosphaerae]
MNRTAPVIAVLAAKAVSDVGFALDFVCLTIFVWVRTESVVAVSWVGLMLYAGGVVGGRLGHRYAARWDRRRVMVIADLVRMGALLVLAALPTTLQVGWLFAAVLVIGAGRAVFEATFAAATPALAGERTQLVNSLASGLKGIALVAGMGLATVAVPLVGFRGVFALDAATYALSAVMLLLLPLRLSESRSSTVDDERARPSIRAAMLAAGVVGLMAVRGLDAFGSSSHHVGLPLLGAEHDPANPAGVTGALWMVWAAGTTLGSFAVRPLLAPLIARSPTVVFYGATAVMSAGFIGIFWLGPWWAMLAAAGIAGVGDALSEITFRQTVQRLPDEQRGAAFGLAQIVINAGFIAGLFTTSLALTPARVDGWVLALHGIPLLAALAVGAAAARAPAAATAAGRPA